MALVFSQGEREEFNLHSHAQQCAFEATHPKQYLVKGLISLQLSQKWLRDKDIVEPLTDAEIQEGWKRLLYGTLWSADSSGVLPLRNKIFWSVAEALMEEAAQSLTHWLDTDMPNN